MDANHGPFPWKIWLKLNGACLPGLVWFIANFSLAEILILAAFTVVPINVLIVVQWARGRIHGDVLGRWGGSRERRIVVASAFMVLFVGTFCNYHYYLGESLERVLLVGCVSILGIGGAVAFGVWLRGQGQSGRGKGRPDLPDVM